MASFQDRVVHIAGAVLALAVVGCASGSLGDTSRASSGTLIDDAHDGAYDAWEVFPATDVDSSIVISASGPDGAFGVIRFVPSNDGSVMIVAEAGGASSQLDLDADGMIAGEAHAPEADAMLAELIGDLDARRDEVFALATSTGSAMSEEGGAREALLGFDFGCAFGKTVAWVLGNVFPVCDVDLTARNYLSLIVVTPERRRVNSVTWEVAGRASTGQPMTLAYRDGLSMGATAHIPKTATEQGLTLRFDYNIEGGREMRTIAVPAGAWTGTRYEIVKFDDSNFCNGATCLLACITRLHDNCSGSCGSLAAEESVCSDSL